MHYRTLGRTGLKLSILGFGASSLGNAFRVIDDAEGIRAVRVSLDMGVNYLDTSPYYGATKSETVLGKALKSVARDSYILATKVGQYGEGEFDFSPARVTRGLDESCRRLGTDYIDVLQCHDIEFADHNQIVNETLPALVKLRAAGRIGFIGITGLPLKIFPSIIDRVPAGTIDTILSFCRYELNDTGLETLIPYFKQRGIGILSAAPTGMGLLTNRGVPAWHPAPAHIVDACRRAAEFCKASGADITKLAVQFSCAHPAITSTIVGSANPANMKANIECIEEPMNYELLAKVLEILKPVRNHNYTRGRPENRDELIA